MFQADVQSSLPEYLPAESDSSLVHIMDHLGNIAYVSSSVEKILGYVPSELMDKKSSGLIHPGDMLNMEKVLQKALNQPGEMFNLKHRLLHKNGNYRWFDTFCVNFLHGKTPNINGFFVFSRDVTHSEERNETFRFYERSYRALMEIMSEGVAIRNENHVLTYANPSLCAMLGYSRAEIIGKKVTEFIDPDYLGRWEDIVREGWEKGTEIPVRRKDGKTVFFRTAPRQMTDRDGNPAGVFVVLTDVTPYREMERELRESEEKFRLLSEQSMLGLIMVQDGNVIYTNQAFADIFEGSIEEVMAIQSYGFFKYIYPDDFAMVHDQVVKKEVGEEEVESHYSYRILTPLGKVKWVEHFSKTVRLHGRNAIFIAMADISEKKRYEEEKRKMEEQLFQLQKLHSLGNLAGEISHDFNNLLHVIRGFAELGKIQEEPESVREYFRTIQETVESGLNLTQKLLLFSRKGEGKKRKFSINRLVEDCLKMVGPLIEKGVKIEFSPGKRIPDILAVHGNLEQVLMNLVLNARDAMPSGGKIQIQTCLRKRKKKFPGGKFSGKCVCLSVKDNGTGISEENRQRIFEPFFTTKEEGEGTGLGLSVVFGIVQSHGGWIELESDLGKGACFNVYLPLLSL